MKQRELIYIMVSMFFLIIVWIIFSIYHSSVTSTITPLVNVQITPISPAFDTKTVNDLRKRESVSPIFEFVGGLQSTSSATSTVSSGSAKTLP